MHKMENNAVGYFKVVSKFQFFFFFFLPVHNDTKVTHASAVYVCASKFYCMYSVLSFPTKCAVCFMCSDNVCHIGTN